MAGDWTRMTRMGSRNGGNKSATPHRSRRAVLRAKKRLLAQGAAQVRRPQK